MQTLKCELIFSTHPQSYAVISSQTSCFGCEFWGKSRLFQTQINHRTGLTRISCD